MNLRAREGLGAVEERKRERGGGVKSGAEVKDGLVSHGAGFRFSGVLC